MLRWIAKSKLLVLRLGFLFQITNRVTSRRSFHSSVVPQKPLRNRTDTTDRATKAKGGDRLADQRTETASPEEGEQNIARTTATITATIGTDPGLLWYKEKWL